MATKATFEATARILRDQLPPLPHRSAGEAAEAALIKRIASRFADHYATQSPRFDRSRFLVACGVQDEWPVLIERRVAK